MSVVTQAFADMARNVGRTMKYPDLPMLVVPHPFETLPVERVRQIADERFEDIVSALSQEQPHAHGHKHG